MTFKPGDRISVYGHLAPAEGGSAYELDGVPATVVSIGPKYWLEVDLDTPTSERYLRHPQRLDYIHPKQCRRLVMKQRNTKE